MMLEENTIKSLILPEMHTADTVHRILKSLEHHNLLHSTKKDRYPLTVYCNRESQRLSFIAVLFEEFFDSNMLLRINESKYSECFMKMQSENNMIPILKNSLNEIAYQRYDYDKSDNLHFFCTGGSGSGKTHALTERIISLSKTDQKIIILAQAIHSIRMQY